jgi:glutaredoxin
VNPTQNKRVTRTTGIQINPVKVNVFTKDDCPRCAFVIEELEKNGVVFLELNTTIAPSNNDLMFEKLKEAGYKENNIQMPVVVNKGEVYYNIKDLKTFVKQFSNK